MWKQGERDETNAGFAAYIGKKRVGWSLDKGEAVQLGLNSLEFQNTHKRFVPCVVIFDCSLIVNVGIITDDSNGIRYRDL